MDQSSQVPHATDILSSQPNATSVHMDDNGLRGEAHINADVERPRNVESSNSQGNEETSFRMDDRSGRAHPTVDVAEVIRRWTHALQRIHKQSLLLAKANDGKGPELLRSAHDGSTSSHADSLASTLVEHQQHLASFQDKDQAPVQKLREEIREAARDKFSKELGERMVDPKLLAAFRAAVTGTDSGEGLLVKDSLSTNGLEI